MDKFARIYDVASAQEIQNFEHSDWVTSVVERFDRRGIEPFELFASEFGQNSLRIDEILLEFIRNPKNSGFFNIFYKYSAKFRQIFIKI